MKPEDLLWAVVIGLGIGGALAVAVWLVDVLVFR